MEVQVKCFATLNKFEPKNKDAFKVEGNSSIRQIIDILKIPLSEVKIVFVNGTIVSLDYKVKAQDRIGIFPAVGGG